MRPRIEAAFEALPDVRVLLFEPVGAPEALAMPASTDAPQMTPGRATLVGLIGQYLAALMDPSVSLLEIHKLMYFMQESGEPLRLRYVKAPYGPYAENLRQVLARVEGHLVSGYADGGDAPDKQLELVPGAMADASAFLADHPATRARFDRVAKLVDGFETSFGLELLSSVHWVARHEGAATADAARTELYRWNDRKRRFNQRQIEVAWQALIAEGWLSVPALGMQPSVGAPS